MTLIDESGLSKEVLKLFMDSLEDPLEAFSLPPADGKEADSFVAEDPDLKDKEAKI